MFEARLFASLGNASESAIARSAAADLLYADLEINIGFASLSTDSVLRMKEIQP